MPIPFRPSRCLAPLAVATAVFAGCKVLDLQPRVGRRDLPQVPRTASLDYEPLAGMAHAALPHFDETLGAFTGPGRVWLKGSAAVRSATVGAGKNAVGLDPPYFTAVVEAPAGEVEVAFTCAGEPLRTVRVTVPDARQLNAPADVSSLLFVGDFQPFHVTDEGVDVNPGAMMRPVGAAPPTSTLVAMRRLLQATAEGRAGAFPRPTFLCGVGDQIYVEGDYHAYPRLGHEHPMSAWTVEAQPRPRVAAADLPRFLDLSYRAHWSFPTFERALQVVPSVMTWDDHEIRDGWGSQGDEHVYRDSHFRHFRDAFVEHQFRRGPRELAANTSIDAPLWQALTWHGVPVFVMDLRSCRDVAVPRVLGDEQWRALRAWFQGMQVSRSPYYVLVSSVPIFYRIADRANLAAAVSDEVRDDLLDTWTSEPNEPEWRALVDEIVAAGERGHRGLIVSGDFHVNSLCRVTMTRSGGATTVLAYEMIAAGLAADQYGDWKQKVARDGWLIESPITTANGTLTTDMGFMPPCPSFLGVSLRGGQLAATWFRAEATGCSALEVPLGWEWPAPGVRTAVQAWPAPVEVASTGR